MNIAFSLRHETLAAIRQLDDATHDNDVEMMESEAVTNPFASDYVVVTPGQVIASDAGFLRGHGTYVENGTLVASVAGIVEKVNQLISVRPLKCRYIGEVGDIVVGRIADCGTKMWKVDVNGHNDALLMLSSVNLPGGAQRRRTYDDQLEMRQHYREAELISAEVQDVRYDGTLALHTRSLRYGKLRNGQFVAVQPSLIKRLKQHVVTLPCQVDLILGNNGYIWITRPMDDTATVTTDTSSSVLESDNRAEVLLALQRRHAETPVARPMRVKIARVYRAIVALNTSFQMISPDSIMRGYTRLLTSETLKPLS